MKNDHLRPLLDNMMDTRSLFKVAELLSKGQVPLLAAQTIKLGRMAALRKYTGGVRGIVSGEVIRRLLSTRAGCEGIAHVLQAVCELDHEATITSIDGISAFDSISRRAMLLGLERVEGGSAVLPFVHLVPLHTIFVLVGRR